MKTARSTTILLTVIAALMAGPLPAVAADVVVTGGGWGHGIGMPQYGAKAMAEAGHSAQSILQYFYTGAQFGWVGSPIGNYAEPLQVGVGQNQTFVQFVPIGTGSVTVTLAGKPYPAAAGQVWGLHSGPEGCWLEVGPPGGASTPVGSAGPCSGEITWGSQPGTRIELHQQGVARTYARGKIVFKQIPGTTSFHVVVVVPMETYLLGLAEVPNTWPMEALKAQAIAARTYALYKTWVNRNGPNPACGCHIYGDTRDQAYRGWYSGGDLTEGGSSGGRWVQAVQNTANYAMWHPKHGSARALEAYYFSNSGGATENNEDIWGGSPYGYLRSKPDPGARFWTQGFGYGDFAARLGFDIVTWVTVTERYVSGSPKRIVVQGTIAGAPVVKNYTGSQLRSVLGLRSHYVQSISGFIPPGSDHVVLHDPTTGIWTYRGDHGGLSSLYYGNPGDFAFYGDWDCDGVDTPGLYRRSDGYAYLRNSNTQGVADISFFFGNPGDIPLAGDFDGDGCDTVSIYRPSEARFYVINRLGSGDAGLGAADYSFLYGNIGDTPFVGDWTGDGIDTPGLRRNSDGFVYLRNTNSEGVGDHSFFYGNNGDVVFSGDWNADGLDTVGLYRPSDGFVYLRNSNTTGVADFFYQMGSRVHRAVGGSR